MNKIPKNRESSSNSRIPFRTASTRDPIEEEDTEIERPGVPIFTGPETIETSLEELGSQPPWQPYMAGDPPPRPYLLELPKPTDVPPERDAEPDPELKPEDIRDPAEVGPERPENMVRDWARPGKMANFENFLLARRIQRWHWG